MTQGHYSPLQGVLLSLAPLLPARSTPSRSGAFLPSVPGHSSVTNFHFPLLSSCQLNVSSQLSDLSPRGTEGLPSPGDAAWQAVQGQARGTAGW